MKKPLLILLTGVLVVLTLTGVWASQKEREVAQRRSELAQMERDIEIIQKKTKDDSERGAALAKESEALRERLKALDSVALAAPAAAQPPEPSRVATERPKGEEPAESRPKRPTIKAMMNRQMELGTTAELTKMTEFLHLSPEEAEAAKAVLREQNENTLAMMGLGENGESEEGEKREPYDARAAMKSLLGEERFAAYETQQRNDYSRTAASGLASRFAAMGYPLQPHQQTAMQTIISEENERSALNPSASTGGAEMLVQMVPKMKETQERVRKRAAALLTPDQAKELAKEQQRQLESFQSMAEIGKSFLQSAGPKQ